MITDLKIPADMKTTNGELIADLSHEKPVMLVFLRHFGCIFCREALKDLSQKRAELEAQGVKLVFVHMSDPEIAYAYFRKYNLEGIDHVSDPECRYYQEYGLVKGNFKQLFGLKNWIRGFEVTMKGTMIGLQQIGDGFQMPGIFLLENGKIRDSFIHQSAADRPDYESLVNCCAA